MEPSAPNTLRPEPYYRDSLLELHHGHAADVAKTLPPRSVQTIVTSPPYFGLRDYGEDDQIGTEHSVEEYISNVFEVFAVLRDVLADDGTLWLNLGDSYSRRKGLLGVPWQVAFALQSDGWILRSDIIWHKPNPMPESVTDRPTKAHEYLFLLTKSPRYYYDAEASSEPQSEASFADHSRRKTSERSNGAAPDRGSGDKGLRANGGIWTSGTRNRRTVWTVPTVPFADAHFATYPPELIRPCVLAGSRVGDTVLDPFSGSGTTGQVALQHGRKYIGIDISREYLDLSLRARFQEAPLDFGGVA